jgi:DNA-binding FadR family transcriptional regulator
MGWPVGQVIGSEASLMERFGGSRNTFREAVRIVEQQGTAWMRKGPGGGLVVTAPDLSHVLRSAAVYLRFQAVDFHQLVQTRIVLETSVVEEVVSRLDEEKLARLRSVVAEEQRAHELAHTTLQRFHVVLGRSSGDHRSDHRRGHKLGSSPDAPSSRGYRQLSADVSRWGSGGRSYHRR